MLEFADLDRRGQYQEAINTVFNVVNAYGVTITVAVDGVLDEFPLVDRDRLIRCVTSIAVFRYGN